MTESCRHGYNGDDCLVCWADFNVELEKLRIEAGLTRGEFEKVIRDSIRKDPKANSRSEKGGIDGN